MIEKNPDLGFTIGQSNADPDDKVRKITVTWAIFDVIMKSILTCLFILIYVLYYLLFNYVLLIIILECHHRIIIWIFLVIQFNAAYFSVLRLRDNYFSFIFHLIIFYILVFHLIY